MFMKFPLHHTTMCYFIDIKDVTKSMCHYHMSEWLYTLWCYFSLCVLQELLVLLWILSPVSGTAVATFSACMRYTTCSSAALAWTRPLVPDCWTICWSPCPTSVARVPPRVQPLAVQVPPAVAVATARIHHYPPPLLPSLECSSSSTPLPLLCPPHPPLLHYPRAPSATPTALLEFPCWMRAGLVVHRGADLPLRPPPPLDKLTPLPCPHSSQWAIPQCGGHGEWARSLSYWALPKTTHTEALLLSAVFHYTPLISWESWALGFFLSLHGQEIVAGSGVLKKKGSA